ncbi:MAG TPA: hypothetical protein VEO54_17130, partial [Thermoanaerobaculia bacterium]|nr:hypothetical protein [Thermoanaerobaculia bacterium]
MHKVPFARLALAFALLVCAFANVHAQGACEAPGEFDFTPQVCPNGQGWAHSRYGPNPGYVWSTYHWTVTGGTIISGANAETMYYTAGPGGTVEITLSVTGNGCSGTKTHTAVITGAQTADIHSNPTVCPYGRSGATVMYGDSQSTYQWSITNGTFVGSTSGSNVQFIASGSGAVGLDVVVSNPGGCNGTGHLDIPIVASPITIETFDSPTCPTEIGRAYAYGPWGGSHLWTAENATILGRVTGAEVRYVPDGTGPVTLTITSTTPDGCTATATRTMPVGTAAVPQLVASKPFVCPSSTVRVSVANAAEFTEYRWETQNASQTGSSPGSVTLQAGPGSTVTATVYAKTASGCERSESIAIPVGLPDGTISAPALVCPTTPFTASVPDAGPGYSYDWIMLDGGTIVAMNGREVTVQPDGGGSIRLRARVFSPTACDAVEAIVIDTAPEMTPGIRFDQPYCGGPSTASIDNAANYATVAWTIQDGVIDGPADGPTVSFHSTSGVAPTLTATVTSPSGCPTAPASAQAPIQTAAVPQLATTPSFCNTGQWLMAQVMNPEQFSSLVFSVANGTITAHNGNFIEISNTGAAPTVVTVDAVTLNGCAVTSSATIPYVAPAVPVITTTPAQHCGVSSTIEATLANASQFTGTGGIYWSVRNGYIVTNDGSSVTIQPTSASGVEITVEAFSSADCLGRASVVVPIGSSAGTPPPIEFESADVCPNGPGTAYVPMGYSSYSWSIENGVLNSSPNNSYVYFTANGSGPVQLSVALGNPDGCPIVSTGTLPLRETAPPVIQFEAADVCPAGPGIAWTDMTNWSAYSWSITNGIIDSNPNNSYVYYSANGNGPVTLTLQTWTVDGCTATTSASQPLRETTPPVIQFEAADVCPTGPGIAWTEMTNWDRYSWSITNGVLTSSPTNSYVYYTADGNGPVTLTLQTWTE